MQFYEMRASANEKPAFQSEDCIDDFSIMCYHLSLLATE